MISTLKRIASTLLIVSFVAPLAGVAFAAAPVTQTTNFSASISPTTASYGQTQTYTLTVTNDVSSNKDIKSVIIPIPAGFTVLSASVTNPSGWTLSTSTTAGSFELNKTANNDLTPGNSLTLVFSATAPGSYTAAEWTANAYTGTQGNGDSFSITSAQPVVTVGTGSVTTYTLAYSAGANGSLTGSSTQIVASGANGTAVTAVPASGFHFLNWSDTSTTNPRTDSNVTNNITVTANFEADSVIPTTYTLTYIAGANGSLTGSSTQVVASGANGTAVTAIPASGFHFVNWSDLSASNPRTDSNVTANHTFTANFAEDVVVGTTTYTLTYTAGANGSLTGSSTQLVISGNNGTAITAVAASGFHFVNWSDESTANPRTDIDVAGNITVSANFAADVPVVIQQIGGAGGTNGVPGCKNPLATNYDPTAVYEGPCTFAPTGEVLGASTSTVPSVGEVLGASTSTLSCGEYLTLKTGVERKALREGGKNDSVLVTLLQRFLNEYAPATLPITGYFGPMTTSAVKKLQAANKDAILAPWGLTKATGLVYVTTVAYINNTKCPQLNITVTEKDLVPAVQ